MSTVLPKIRRIAHIVLFVADPEASAKWYQEVLGMTRVAQAKDGPYKGGIFMSFGYADHDIALFPEPAGASKGKEFEHIGLVVDCEGDLEKLQRLYGHLVKHNVRIAEVLNHGVSKGVYFYDPDGHMLEVFCQQLEGEASRQELGRNEGMAEPYPLEPIF